MIQRFTIRQVVFAGLLGLTLASPGFCDKLSGGGGVGGGSSDYERCSIEHLQDHYSEANTKDKSVKARLAIAAALTDKTMEEVNDIYSKAKGGSDDIRARLTFGALLSGKPIEDLNAFYTDSVASGEHRKAILAVGAALSNLTIEDLDTLYLEAEYEQAALAFGAALSGKTIEELNMVFYEMNEFIYGDHDTLARLAAGSVITGKSSSFVSATYKEICGHTPYRPDTCVRMTLAGLAGGLSAKQMLYRDKKTKNFQAILPIASALTVLSMGELNKLYSQLRGHLHNDDNGRLVAGSALCSQSIPIPIENRGMLLAILVGVLEVL